MIAVIKDPEVARKILTAMGLPADAPMPARAPPLQAGFEFSQDGDVNFPIDDGTQDVA